eukprot:205235_1
MAAAYPPEHASILLQVELSGKGKNWSKHPQYNKIKEDTNKVLVNLGVTNVQFVSTPEGKMDYSPKSYTITVNPPPYHTYKNLGAKCVGHGTLFLTNKYPYQYGVEWQANLQTAINEYKRVNANPNKK